MKTGQEVLTRALKLLGYTNNNGEIDTQQNAELFKRGSVAVNQIYFDLQRIESPTTFTGEDLTMSQNIPLSITAVNDVMPYGVASLLAQGDGNNELYLNFAAQYDNKRKSIKKPVMRITDVIPMGGY